MGYEYQGNAMKDDPRGADARSIAYDGQELTIHT